MIKKKVAMKNRQHTLISCEIIENKEYLKLPKERHTKQMCKRINITDVSCYKNYKTVYKFYSSVLPKTNFKNLFNLPFSVFTFFQITSDR